jgi:hypothetical protein
VTGLFERFRSLPLMTSRERALQALDWAYGNLAATMRHKPVRAAFKNLWAERGLPVEEFDAWAAEREWYK